MKLLSNHILFTLLSCLVLGSCSKYLDRAPQDQITTQDYWKIPDDIKLYVNQFYTSLPAHVQYTGIGTFGLDNNSDNMIGQLVHRRLAGLNTINDGSYNWHGSITTQNWNYTNIRNVNYGLENYRTVDGPQADIDKYVGELYFFRAFFYFHMVKTYGDVPWVNKVLSVDSEELYGARIPRNIVIDSVLNDLNRAVAQLPLKSAADANRLNKEVALLFKSRVALYEGTWQKYHANDEFGTPGANWEGYLQTAAAAARELIDLNTASLYQGDPDNYFKPLFAALDMSGNPEILLWKRYGADLQLFHSTVPSIRSGGNTGVTKQFVDSYLCEDGLPISVSPLYQGDHTLSDAITNRDPRLRQSIWVPGDPAYFSQSGDILEYFTTSWLSRQEGGERNITGYQLKKGFSSEAYSVPGGHTQTEGSVVFRYAEALLNYAEARAELNVLTQDDIDISINKLRERAQMPDLVMAAIVTDPDWDFPVLSPVINEIRRERRVELFAEGFRFDDLARWAGMELIIGTRPKGAYFVQSDYPNLTPGVDIFLDGAGYVDPFQVALPAGYGFQLNRDYLVAVPQQELTLNKNLDPNPNW